MGLYYPFIQTIGWLNIMVENGKKVIRIRQWVLVVSIVGVLMTIISMGGMLINDRYVVINKSDLNTENIADLTLVVDKLITKIEGHVKLGGHDLMNLRMDKMEEEFAEMKADIKEILRRTPR